MKKNCRSGESDKNKTKLETFLDCTTAIRRMHRQFGHPSSTVLVQILRLLPITFRHADIFDVTPVKTTKPKHQSANVALEDQQAFVDARAS